VLVLWRPFPGTCRNVVPDALCRGAAVCAGAAMGFTAARADTDSEVTALDRDA
jgi:hypothetical protein